MLVGIAIVIVAGGVLLWLGIGRGAVFYYSVSELLAVGAAQHVRVSGELQEGSLANRGADGFVFTVRDRDTPADRVKIVYRGALPDAFRNESGAEVVAEGDYDGKGTFTAATLITKCPSKYEAAE